MVNQENGSVSSAPSWAIQPGEWVIARRYLTDASMAQLHASRQTDAVHVVELVPGA
ncbi:hypothetical protein ABIA33_007698 [Streptacidiphilus sp. MAP12-16]|uniref:hypothetical protein n=1 Tax=Streptacidiphilus sp. MAP12-16 TaxID=3156300 RepID=UPI0035197D22